jgi:hypothetical protein
MMLFVVACVITLFWKLLDVLMYNDRRVLLVAWATTILQGVVGFQVERL